MSNYTEEDQKLFMSVTYSTGKDQEDALLKLINLGYDKDPKVMQYIGRVNLHDLYLKIKLNNADFQPDKIG